MRLSRSAKVILGVVTALVFLFIYLPLLLVVVLIVERGRWVGEWGGVVRSGLREGVAHYEGLLDSRGEKGGLVAVYAFERKHVGVLPH